MELAPLTPKNEQVMEGLKHFMKYNVKLVHMDLQMTGLPLQIIRQIGTYLTRATSLRCIHLCGNQGVTNESIEWIRRRIKAKDETDPVNIQPLPKHLSRKNQPKP